MMIDYMRVYQNTAVDNQAPTNFTATLGSVTGSSVELLLNAQDNSGTIAYTISYSGGTFTVYNPSGNQKSIVIPNLPSNTNYTFTITATDMSGNSFVNNPIVLNATTTTDPGCSGNDSEAQEGAFIEGYNYSFQTIGTDVKIAIELLDDKVGLVAFLRNQSPFSETQMTNVSGQIFTQTISGQTIGSTINYAVKFAFSGGLAVTKFLSYEVGFDCSLGVQSNTESIAFSFQNPVNDKVNINSNVKIEKVEIYNLLGNLDLNTTVDTERIDVSNLSKGVYLLTVYSGKQKSEKKLIINTVIKIYK
jgi:hypothetical protein